MTNNVKLRLQSLSKYQLVKLIEDYKYALDIIGEICVDESKGVDAHSLFIDIRLLLREFDSYDLNSDNLVAEIDLRMGKITPEKFRSIVLGDDNDE